MLSLKCILLLWHHFSIFSRSLCIFVGFVDTSLKSSAYPNAEHFDVCCGRSFIYIMKSRGPRRDPWGTPLVTGTVSDSESFTFTDRHLIDN